MLQKALDSFYSFRKSLLDWIAFVSLRLYGIEDCSLTEVRKQTYTKRERKTLDLDRALDVDALLSLARESYGNATERRKVVTDKFKTLQGLSAFLLAIIGLLLPKAFNFDPTLLRILFFVAVLFLLNAVTLLLIYLAVGAEATPELGEEHVKLNAEDLKKALINDYGSCTVMTDNRTDYLVDIYKTARFFFLLSFTTMIVLFSISYFSRVGSTDTKKIIQELRSDPGLIELLRGPEGDEGGKGDEGDRATSGPPAVMPNAGSRTSTISRESPSPVPLGRGP